MDNTNSTELRESMFLKMHPVRCTPALKNMNIIAVMHPLMNDLE